jgi:hypothetical protein
MPELHVSNGFKTMLPGLGKNIRFSDLSQKRVSRCVREEALRPRYGERNVRLPVLRNSTASAGEENVRLMEIWRNFGILNEY